MSYVEYRIRLLYPTTQPLTKRRTHYDIPSYNRLCNEFGICPSTDFRFHEGMNHGLGNVYIYISSRGSDKTDAHYPGSFKFSDEGGSASDGNLFQYIEFSFSEKQYKYFVVPVSYGFTKVGQARINQSIEAFMYCTLGSQANVRSSILGNAGSAQEVRREFLVLMEDAIKQPDIRKSEQRFQLAVQEAKVKLEMAISPGTWLMPSRMVINTESTIGYNSKLKRVSPSMKLGVNSDVNVISRPVGIKHILGASKIILPHASTEHAFSHVESHVVKHALKESGSAAGHPDTSKHEMNLIVLMIAARATAWLLFR